MAASSPVTKPPPSIASSRFLTQMYEAILRHGHSEDAGRIMIEWCRRYILFHAKKHPQEMNLAEIAAYLEYVAKSGKTRCAQLQLRAWRWSFFTVPTYNERSGSFRGRDCRSCWIR